jgi:hypothetical protein
MFPKVKYLLEYNNLMCVFNIILLELDIMIQVGLVYSLQLPGGVPMYKENMHLFIFVQ